MATLQDIMKHRVIVVTLSISMDLSNIGLTKGTTLAVNKLKIITRYSPI